MYKKILVGKQKKARPFIDGILLGLEFSWYLQHISVLLHTTCCSAMFFKDNQICFLYLHEYSKENFFSFVCFKALCYIK